MTTHTNEQTAARSEPTPERRPDPNVAASPGAAFSHVMSTALGFAASRVSQTADDWTDRLNEIAQGGGARQEAGARGLRAGLEGKNPVWAAIKGAWSAGSAQVRAAIVSAVAALVLLLLLSPVLLLVFLLSLLIIAAVQKVKAAKR